ncbi:hypothetical protein AAHE18_09G023900 [Arachis hypogaea]|nr:uncharacterized protein DS421_9g255860 [Arachis hypogaea]
MLMSDLFFLVLAKWSNPTIADREILTQEAKKLTDVPIPFIGINVHNFPNFETLLQDHLPCTVLLRGSRCVERYDYIGISAADIARFTNIRIEAANSD